MSESRGTPIEGVNGWTEEETEAHNKEEVERNWGEISSRWANFMKERGEGEKGATNEDWDQLREDLLSALKVDGWNRGKGNGKRYDRELDMNLSSEEVKTITFLQLLSYFDGLDSYDREQWMEGDVPTPCPELKRIVLSKGPDGKWIEVGE